MSLGLGLQEVCKRGSKKAGVARTEERGGAQEEGRPER